MFIEKLPVVKTVKVLIAQTGCLQKFVDRKGITHEFCNEQAIKIMRQDGYTVYADILTKYKTELALGVMWADMDWKNISHYYIPGSGRGLWRFASALDDYCEYFQKAIMYVKDKDYNKAAFHLGAAAHLIQDMCVPHHARGVLFQGHKEFESWAEEKRELYAVEDLGIYSDNNILISNAKISADLFSKVSHGDTSGYQEALKILLPLSQRTTAGLFCRFFEAVRGNYVYKIAVA